MDNDIEEELECLGCGGTLIFMGLLGNCLHYRCRHCGGECHEFRKVSNADSK